MAAASRVFAIPELLEKILLYLPERDLLLTQRVNKAFRNVADSSLHLQRKLFLRADVDSEDGPVPNLKWNPLIDIFGLEKGSQDAISADRTVMYRNFWGRWRRVHIESTMSLNDFVCDLSRAELLATDGHLDRGVLGIA